MVVVPAGSFMMGSLEGKGDSDERQQRKVTIINTFAVSKFAVTAEQWQTCVTYGGCKAGGNKGKQPVSSVSWYGAQHYAAWLSKMTGHNYRLLTEAEWEYAARGGSTTAYFWGDEIGEGNANCKGCGSKWDGKQAAAVGSFKPNAFGLYDMHGNVWELVADNWHKNYRGNPPTDGSAWKGGDTSLRVLHGGSWGGSAQLARSASRSRVAPGGRYEGAGFRLARTLTP